MHAKAADSAPDGPAPGDRVGGYELIRAIGQGGMGRVFLARDLTLGRRVALKLLRSDADSALARRFLVEARATARCVHENIVVIHEVSSFDGLPYMVLEYLEGQTLREVLQEGALTLTRALTMMTAVARAMVCAHEAGIIHRDLKPDNIFVTRQGVIKVLDFGIATLLRPTDEGALRDLATLTQIDRGRMFGTGPYMAPEHLAGQDTDGRTDIFSFGVILYRALTGGHPAGTTDTTAITAALRDRSAPFPSIAQGLPALPEQVVQLVDRCVEKLPERRFQSATELLLALEELDPRAPRHRRDDACPYPGLAGFTASDADRFFGRAGDLQRAKETLRSRAVLAVIGQSGAGKSSFAHAGVAASLAAEREPWTALCLRPGARPLASLMAALQQLPGAVERAADQAALAAEPGRFGQWLRAFCQKSRARLVIVVDQAEEAFTLCRDRGERRAFWACLLGAADDASAPIRLVFTLRSDFLQEVATLPELADAVVLGTQLLAPLEGGGLRAALEGPLALADYRFEEPAHIDEIVDAFAGAPHALPMLQAVATQLWDHRDRQRRIIPRQAIAAIGGVAGALARYADNVFAALSPSEQAIAETIFVRLVTSRGTRATAPRAELLATGEAAARVLRALLDARLLVARDDDATVELAHEVLISGWPRLGEWLAASHGERLLRERVEHAAAAWIAHQKAAELTWDGEVLSNTEAMLRGAAASLSRDAKDFLFASKQRRDRRRRRRRLGLVGVVAGAGAIAFASVTALALVHRAERAASSEAARATAEASRATAEASRATAEAARSAAAERALAEKVRVLEQTEAARARAAAEASERARVVAAQREVIERREEALRAALSKAQTLLGQRDESLRAAEALRLDLESALARERENLARERERAEALARRQAKIIGELPP